jgi:transposase
MPNQKPHPTDVSDEEWAFVAPYLALVREDAPQCLHDLREVFNALRSLVYAWAPSWRMLPHNFPWKVSEESLSLPGRRECCFTWGSFERNYVNNTRLFVLRDAEKKHPGLAKVGLALRRATEE